MKRVTNDSRTLSGLGFAVLSAMSFGLAGTLGRGLLDSGWTAGAAVTARILVATAVLLVPALISLRGRWYLVRGNAGLLAAYGIVAVAGCQLAYFNAVNHLQVGVALLIEYTAPVAIVGWLWLRHGQRPGRRTAIGGALALVGLALVLDLVSGADLDPIGVAWALAAMLGAACYFVLSAREVGALPPLALAAGGLLTGAVSLLLAGWVGVVPMEWAWRSATYGGTHAGAEVPWWVSVLGLGVVTAAFAYVTGIAATRRLGSRLASFVALLEVLFALVFAWILLDELPAPVQFAGAAVVLAGVVLVKLGERDIRPVGATAPEAEVVLSDRPAGG